MDSIFLKSLADVVKLSRTVTNLDQLTFHSQLATDIKTELNSKNDQAKQQALLKLFYLFMQASSIKWAEFNVINLMASQDYNTKRISFLIAHQVIDHQSQGLIMLTNLFKKELSKSQNPVECSNALSCLGLICNKDLAETILAQVVNLTSHSKPVIRKKALAVLARIFTMSPASIPNNLEKVISKLANDEQNPTVIATGVALISQVLKISPSLYPLFIKFIYDQLLKQKSNWLLIKLVRISNSIIKLEPRFQKKLIEPYRRLISQTNSKSLQYELIYSILRYFKDQDNLFENTCELLKTFIDHQDANLRSLGLECLTQLLESSPNSLSDFQDQLQESFIKGDYFYKIQILELFKEYVSSRNYVQVVNFYLKSLEKEGDSNMRSQIIGTIIHISWKNKFENVEDPEQLFTTIVPLMVRRIESGENAEALKKMVVELLGRIPELYEEADKLCVQILSNLEEQQDQFDGVNLKIIKESNQLRYSIGAKETIFKAIIMISGEATKRFTLATLLKVLRQLSTFKSLQQFQNSIAELHSLLFKVRCLSFLLADRGPSLPPAALQQRPLRGGAGAGASGQPRRVHRLAARVVRAAAPEDPPDGSDRRPQPVRATHPREAGGRRGGVRRPAGRVRGHGRRPGRGCGAARQQGQERRRGGAAQCAEEALREGPPPGPSGCAKTRQEERRARPRHTPGNRRRRNRTHPANRRPVGPRPKGREGGAGEAGESGREGAGEGAGRTGRDGRVHREEHQEGHAHHQGRTPASGHDPERCRKAQARRRLIHIITSQLIYTQDPIHTTQYILIIQKTRTPAAGTSLSPSLPPSSSLSGSSLSTAPTSSAESATSSTPPTLVCSTGKTSSFPSSSSPFPRSSCRTASFLAPSESDSLVFYLFAAVPLLARTQTLSSTICNTLSAPSY